MVEGGTGEELGVSRIAFGREQPLPKMRENENKYRGYQTSRPQVLRILFMLLLTAFARFHNLGPSLMSNINDISCSLRVLSDVFVVRSISFMEK